MIGLWIALAVVLYAAHAYFLSRLFQKAGVPVSAAWIPVYNLWRFYRLAGLSGWWAVVALIPVANIVAYVAAIVAAYVIGIRLDKNPYWTILFGVCPLAWLIVVGLDRSTWSAEVPENLETRDMRIRLAAREIVSGNAMISVLAVVLAIVAGGALIAATDENVQQAAGYFFSRPLDTFQAIWDSVAGAYTALFQGSVYNFRRDSFANGIKPLTDTLMFATPLIVAGLGVGLTFRVGMFNIGGRGQMLIAAAAAGWVSFSFDLPMWIHLPLAVLAGIVGGAFWAGIVGVLKARTGAHEVIVTIMLNYVAFYLIQWMLRTPGLLQAPGSNNPKTPPMSETAVFPAMFGPKYSLHWGFVLAIIATGVVWWLLSRSSLGFQFRAVGENPSAARVAGINVKMMYVYAMLISGGLVGLAGVSQVLGTVKTGFSDGIDAGIGFDAITVALLGRSKPWGIFWAGILFGAFKAGGFSMQASEGIPIDIVLVVQSMIVLFIAAPPLIRAIFRLPNPARTLALAQSLSATQAATTVQKQEVA